MLKWTTRGSLNDSDSSHAQFPMVEKSTIQAYSSVIDQLSKVSNSGPVHVNRADTYHPQPQGQQKTHGGSSRHSTGALMAPTSPSGRRPFLTKLNRSTSLSRGDKSTVEGQGLRYASSRSLPSSPQTAHNAQDDTQKKTGVLGKFKKLFRTTKSVNKVYKVDSATAGKFSPGPARRRSRSPFNREDIGNVKGSSSSKTRLTRLIASKRGERKQTRSNFSIQKSAQPHKSESISSAEEHPYVQHSQVDKTLFLQNEPVLGSDAPERTGSDLPPSRFRQNQQRHRNSATVNSTALPRNIRFPELGAGIQNRQGQIACLQRSSSLRSSIDTHGYKCSKAGVFDPKSPNSSLENPQRRRWSSQSTNMSLLGSNRTERQPASSKLPRSGSGLVSQPVNKHSCSDDSLFKFGESLMTMLELGSLKKVKVMPSQPDIIIQARKSLSPVYKNLPWGSPQEEATTPRRTSQDVEDRFKWSVTDDGDMLITPTTNSCKPDKVNHKQSDLVSPDSICWPRNNNNGRRKIYDNTNIHQPEEETSDTFFNISKVDTIGDEQRRGCAVSAEGNDSERVTTEHNNRRAGCESPVSLYVGTDQKCEVSRVRVRAIVKSIEEQCEGISKRSFPDYAQPPLVFGDGPEESEFDSHRTTDDGPGSDSTVAIPPGWIQETGVDVDKVNDICAISPMVTCRHNYSSGESQGFSPKVCSSVSEGRSSVPTTLNDRAVVDDGSDAQSPDESEICDSSAGNRTPSSASPQSSYTASIPSDMINDTWTFPSDVFSDSSNVDSLVRNIALTNKAAKSATTASTPSQSDKIGDRHNETAKSPMGKRRFKKVVRKEKLEKCDNESEYGDSTRESLTSHNQRDDASPLFLTSNQEEGITDVRAPVILQDSSLLETIKESTVDLPDEPAEGSHHQLNSSSVETMLEASPILSAIAETHTPRPSLLTQKSQVLEYPKLANCTTSEMEQTESMTPIQSASDHSGFLQTTDFKWEQEEPDSLAHLQHWQTKSTQNQHLHEGETERLTPTGLQQGQADLVMSAFVQGTTPYCPRVLQEPVEPPAVFEWRAQDLASLSSQVGNTNDLGDLGSEDSRKETNQVHEYGESLKQTNGQLGETTLLEPTQQSKHIQIVQSTCMFSGNLDCIDSKRLLVESLIPSNSQCGEMEIPTPTNKLSGKEESLQPTDSSDGLVASPGVVTKYGSRSGDGKLSPIVKPKKKVSFNLDTPQPDSTSSLSGVAEIEAVPCTRTTADGQRTTADGQQTSVDDAGHDVGQADTNSSTDVSGSFSLGSYDGQGLKQQAASSSGDDVTWWGPDASEDINFFHDEVNHTDIKETEDKCIFDAKRQTANIELPGRHDALHGAVRKYSSTTSLPENNINTAGAIQPNQRINTATDIFTWFHSWVAESASGVNTQTITGKTSDNNQDANSTFALNRGSDKHIQEQSLQHRPASCMQIPQKPSKKRDENVNLASSDITNEGKHVHPVGSTTSNEDENVHPIYSDIAKDDRSYYRTDSNIINRDENASLSDNNSLTYDVLGTLGKSKKATTPWWEQPVTPATDDHGPENVAPTTGGPSKLSELLNPRQAAPGSCGLPDCLPQSSLRDPTVHADKKRSERERALTANHTSQAFGGKHSSRESPDICLKQRCQRDNPGEHGDRRREPTTATTSVQPRSSDERVEYRGRSCVRAFSPEKRHASFTGERRAFALDKLCNTPTQPGHVTTNGDIETCCDGEKCVFDASSPSKGDNPATARSSQPGYSRKAQGPNEVAANKKRTCNTGANKKHQPEDAATSSSNPLAGVTAQSESRTMTQHGGILTHTDSQPGLKHCRRPSKRHSCGVMNVLQQPCSPGENPHTFLEVKGPPTQTSPCKSDQHVSLPASETVVPTRKPCAADNRHTVTRQSRPYSPRTHSKSSSTQNIYSSNCAFDTEYDEGMDSKKGQRKNRKYKYEFGCNVHTCDRSESDDGLPALYRPHEHLAESNSSESENHGRRGESSPLKLPQQQCSPNFPTCSLGTKYLCKQWPSDTGGGSSQTDHISRPNSCTSQHNQGDWPHSSESAPSYMARPAASKPYYIGKTSLTGSRSLYTNRTRSDSPKTQHCNTHGSSSPTSLQIHRSWFDVPQPQSSSTGRGDSCTTPKSRLDSQPGQWLFIATFFMFQIFLHWLYAR
ncbi:hypothetical protein BsWGS_10682 [Bradybaena similaris]